MSRCTRGDGTETGRRHPEAPLGCTNLRAPMRCLRTSRPRLPTQSVISCFQTPRFESATRAPRLTPAALRRHTRKRIRSFRRPEFIESRKPGVTHLSSTVRDEKGRGMHARVPRFQLGNWRPTRVVGGRLHASGCTTRKVVRLIVPRDGPPSRELLKRRLACVHAHGPDKHMRGTRQNVPLRLNLQDSAAAAVRDSAENKRPSLILPRTPRGISGVNTTKGKQDARL